ncbi:MAG: hypothetical protein GF411_14275 [Candidatus Lokiarchaeota archaeon]|nr:hypothetical protein [Candidatus Lokiarchaeota archaeon]
MKCPICDKKVKNQGALVSHMRTHVKRGEVIESKDPISGKMFFDKVPGEIVEEKTFTEDAPFAMLGDEPVGGQPKKVWEVPIDQYKAIDPRQYFVTTGEAIIKIDQLIGDLKNLQSNIKKLRTRLLKAKSESKYLETAWEQNKLIVKRKDPRRKSLR